MRSGRFSWSAVATTDSSAQTSITDGWQGATTRSLSRIAFSSRLDAAPGQSTSTKSWLRLAVLMSPPAR